MITSLCKKFGAVCYMPQIPCVYHICRILSYAFPILQWPQNGVSKGASNPVSGLKYIYSNYAIICSRASPTPTDDYLYPSKKILWRIRLIFFYFQSSPCEIIMSPFDVHFATGLFHIISYLDSLWDAIMGKVVSPRYLMLNSPYPLVMSTVCYWKWPSRNSEFT